MSGIALVTGANKGIGLETVSFASSTDLASAALYSPASRAPASWIVGDGSFSSRRTRAGVGPLGVCFR